MNDKNPLEKRVCGSDLVKSCSTTPSAQNIFLKEIKI